MYGKSPMHQRPLVTWILVADNRKAQIYNFQKNAQIIPFKAKSGGFSDQDQHQLKLTPVQDSQLEPQTLQDFHSGCDLGDTSPLNSCSCNSEPKSGVTIRNEKQKRFLKAIALKLEQSSLDGDFDQLILVTPAKMLGELRLLLTFSQDKIVAVLSKDLTQYEGQELIPYLQDTLVEAQVI